jgi:hypothetical protein
MDCGVAMKVKTSSETKKPGIAKAIRAGRTSSLAGFFERPQAEQIGADRQV